MGIQNIKKNKTVKVKHHYKWQFWVVVTALLVVIAAIILWFGLSVKAAVQDIQILTYDNRTIGIVTVAEFEGEHYESDGNSNGNHTRYDYIHYIIEFEHEILGQNNYEYTAHDMISTEKYVGDQYLVLMSKPNKPVLIQKNDVYIDNICLITFIFIIIIAFIVRKHIIKGMRALGNKFDSYI